MKAREKIIPAFLTGGGKMGDLIRSFDRLNTAVESPDTWPQSLRIAERIMLDTPFGMYIAWGNEYVQLYNEGYRPIPGATKHRHAIHFQGLGIGLYISHKIIERHNGKLWAESEPEKGSTFYFTLPL